MTQGNSFYTGLLPILASVAFAICTAALTASHKIQQLDDHVDRLEITVQNHEPLPGRIDKLETTIERHEKTLERDFMRHEELVAALGSKTEDQEKRLTRLEALVNQIQALLTEIRSDLKVLSRGGQQ